MTRDLGLEEVVNDELRDEAWITGRAMFGGWAWLADGNLLCAARHDGILVPGQGQGRLGGRARRDRADAQRRAADDRVGVGLAGTLRAGRHATAPARRGARLREDAAGEMRHAATAPGSARGARATGAARLPATHETCRPARLEQLTVPRFREPAPRTG